MQILIHAFQLLDFLTTFLLGQVIEYQKGEIGVWDGMERGMGLNFRMMYAEAQLIGLKGEGN